MIFFRVEFGANSLVKLANRVGDQWLHGGGELMKDEISHFGMDSLYSTLRTDSYFQGEYETYLC